MLVHVDCYDRVATCNFRSQQPRKADRTDAEHRETIACARLHNIEHCTRARLSTAGECANMFKRSVVAHFHGKAFVCDGEIAK